MQYFIYDTEGQKQALLQNCTSVQWSPNYWESGTFEIHARRTEDNEAYLINGNRVVCVDRNEIGFITSVLKEDDELEVHGALNNLSQRINTTTATIRNIEQGLLNLVTNNKRGLDINVGAPKGLTPKIKAGSQTTYDTLEESFASYCQTGALGFREIVKDGVLNYIEIYEGALKSKVIFSDDLGNIKSQSFEVDASDYKNYAYVYGEESGDSRKSAIVDIHKDGEQIRELYVDARDLQTEYEDESGETQTYTDEEYQELLIERGTQKLADANANAYTFDFSLDPYNQIAELGKDYDLGDIIIIKSNEYGVLIHARITGLSFVEETNQETEVSITTSIESQEVLG